MTHSANPEPKPGRPRILIVDHDPAAIRLLEQHLASADYEVLSARNGLEALHLVLTEEPAMLLTDWCMPQMDGLELCRTIRAESSAGFVYIILTSTIPNEERMVQALDAGADDFLVKPISRQALLARVRAGQRIVDLHRDLERHNRDVHRINVELAVANRRLNTLATIDDLTGAFNRREAMARLADLWAAHDRHHEPLSCVLLDIDGFKVVNDTFGHAVGDLMLERTGKVLQDTSRAGESVCRTGGEEFLLICPKSDVQAALGAAERIRQAVVANKVCCNGRELSVTVSLGVAERNDSMSGPDDLLKAADEALYAAKRTGKNRACVAGQGPKPPIVGGHLVQEQEPSDESVTVLVIDADADNRACCRQAVARNGFGVIEATDADAGLRAIQEHCPDVILLDSQVPGVVVPEFARHLKADPQTRDIPLLVMGPPDGKDDLLMGLESGADEYLAKPIQPAELSLRVGSMAKLRRAVREVLRSNSARGEQARRLNVLLDLSQSITVVEGLDAILQRTAITVAELILCRQVVILLAEPDGQHLRVGFACGLDPASAQKIRVPLGRGMVGKAFTTGARHILHPNRSNAEDLAQEDPALRLKLPMVCSPLIASERTVGVLVTADTLQGDAISLRQLQYIDMVCNLAASAIQDQAARRDRDDARDSVVAGLAALAECRDNNTGKHLQRVTRYSVVLARHLQQQGLYGDAIDDHFLANLRRAVPLHDIGKVGIPDRILLKSNRLNDAEMAIMTSHAEIGAQTIQAVISRAPGVGFLDMAEQIAMGHHERYDGSGYPQGMIGEQIPLCARVTTVADVYDALTTRRPYKEPFPHSQAVQIITQGSGTHFDPQIVDAFVAREQDFHALAVELADEPRSDAPNHASSKANDQPRPISVA